jgi:hypothetical protein
MFLFVVDVSVYVSFLENARIYGMQERVNSIDLNTNNAV